MRYVVCAALVIGLTAAAAAAVPRVISHEVLAEVQPNSSVLVTETIKGFQEYICRTERHDVEWQEQHSRVGELLPYAIALGVRDKLEQAFRGVDLPPRNSIYAEEDDEPHRLYMASSLGLLLEIGRVRQQLH